MSARSRAQKLTKILDTHAAWEMRTLADLRVAGFKFTTVEAAFRYRTAQQTLARMSADDLIDLVASRPNTKESN